MDYHNIPYVPIETNPISKKEVKQDAILLEGVLVVDVVWGDKLLWLTMRWCGGDDNNYSNWAS